MSSKARIIIINITLKIKYLQKRQSSYGMRE